MQRVHKLTIIYSIDTCEYIYVYTKKHTTNFVKKKETYNKYDNI